jgi:hypothetical protein
MPQRQPLCLLPTLSASVNVAAPLFFACCHKTGRMVLFKVNSLRNADFEKRHPAVRSAELCQCRVVSDPLILESIRVRRLL